MGDKRRIYLITDSYPYGRGEKTFIESELDQLCNWFDVTIISCGNTKESKDADYIKRKRISVINYTKAYFNTLTLILCVLRVFFERSFWEEFRTILSSRVNFYSRIKTSFWFIYEALVFKQWLTANHMVETNVIYYTYWYYAHTLSLIFLKKKNSLKIITRAHGYDLHDETVKGGREPCKVFMDSWLDSIIFISEEGYNYYLKHNGIIGDQRHQIYRLGAPKSICQEEILVNDNREETFVLCSCSSINKWKRLELIIEAISLINEYRIKWVHFGDGEMWKSVTNLAEMKLGNKPNISYSFRGYVERDVIYEEYSKNGINCYILVSSDEGLPVSNMEALANGMPIISTNVGGCYETVEGNGVLLDANPKPIDIKKAIDFIKNMSKEEYVTMRRKSIDLWKERFNDEKNMQEFANYIKSI